MLFWRNIRLKIKNYFHACADLAHFVSSQQGGEEKEQTFGRRNERGARLRAAALGFGGDAGDFHIGL